MKLKKFKVSINHWEQIYAVDENQAVKNMIDEMQIQFFHGGHNFKVENIKENKNETKRL